MRNLHPFMALLLTLLLGGSAEAELVTHRFSGTITISPESEGFPWPPGTAFTGTFTYDTSTPGTYGGFFTGTEYVHTPPYDASIGLDITIDGTLLESDDTQDFTVAVALERGGQPGFNQLMLVGFGPVPLVHLWALSFFSDESLPTALFLEDFPIARLFVPDHPSGFIVEGPFDSLEPVTECGDGLDNDGDGLTDFWS